MPVSQFAVVDVSPEMTTIVGNGDLSGVELPQNAAVLVMHLSTTPRLEIHANLPSRPANPGERQLTLVVMRSALQRLFDWSPARHDGAAFHIPHDLVAIGERIWAEGSSPQVTHTYRLGKSIELLCELVEAIQQGSLMPFQDPGSLSLGDARRLLAAKQMIDEHWAEKLTLGQIARRCGLNRTKLSRGFRELYSCTISEALVDRRLDEARRQLLSTDLPVGVIGYRSGYSNNASFTRAFGRRFGLPPSNFRSAPA